MTYDRHLVLTAFKFFCGESEDICRLCLGSAAGQTMVNIGDSTVIRRPYCEDSVTYTEMFEELGVPIDESLPQNLCKLCADTVTNAYLFNRLCNYSNKKWVEVANKLDSSLNLTDSIGSNAKSVYLLVEETGTSTFTSRTKDTRIKKDLLLKIQNTIRSRKNYAKAKNKPLKCVKCMECNEIFKSNCLLSKHNVLVHNKTKNSCPQCARVFTTANQLECHAERVHYQKKLQCPKCDKRFSTHRMLKYHDNFHHEAAICKLCCVQFPSKYILRAHLDKHEIYNCSKCDKSFINIHTFKAHQKFCLKGEQRRPKFFCDICKKGYIHKNGIRSHLKTDHGFGEVLSCKWCGKKYDAVSKLKNHVVKHTRERNFHCEHCGNRFVTQAVYHVRLHTGERPYPCELCNESFLSASRRMEHKRRKHFGPTKQCPLCPMLFTTGSQLRKHMQRHNNPHSKLYRPSADEMQISAMDQYMPSLCIVGHS